MNTVPNEIKLFNWKHSWILLALIGALTIHIKESMYRLGTFDSIISAQAIAVLLPLIVINSFTLFWAFRRNWKGEAPSFLAIWAVFIFFIVVSRIIITTVYAGEPMNFNVLEGLALLVYGLYLTTQNGDSFTKVLLGVVLLAQACFTKGIQAFSVFSNSFEFGWWMLYLFVTALVLAVEENICRRAAFERYFAFRTLIIVLPMDFTVNTGTFYGYRQAVPTFMFAWAVYTIYDVILRIINNKLLGESFKIVHALGMMLIVLGTFLSYLGGLG